MQLFINYLLLFIYSKYFSSYNIIQLYQRFFQPFSKHLLNVSPACKMAEGFSNVFVLSH